jgi:hypothetical protein
MINGGNVELKDVLDFFFKKQPEFDLSLRYREFPQLSPEEMKALLESRLKIAAHRDFISQWEGKVKAMMQKSSTAELKKMAESMQQQIRNNDELMRHPEIRRMWNELNDKLKGDAPRLPGNDDGPLPPIEKPEPAPKMDVKAPDLDDAFRPPTAPPDDEMIRWLSRLMEDAESSGFGRYLVQSPAWQEMMTSLREGGLGQQQAAGLPFKGMVGKLGDTARDLWRPEWSWRPKLGQLPTPDLGGWRPPSIAFPSLRLSPPSAPSMPSAGQMDFQVFGWLVLAVLVVTLLWMWSRNIRQPTAVRRATLGDWPIAPDKVSTRRQMIQAFDYLAQLRLGPEAVYWNHRKIAKNLGDSSGQQGQAAQRLAGVYETVRYAQGPESLDAGLDRQQSDAVRRDLCLLAQANSSA